MNNNQFTRLKLLIGNNSFKSINNLKVLVLGLGGVGSYVVEALVRSGVGTIVLVDFDKIDITNLNRQLMTNLNNIGCLKTDVIEKRILEINPNVKIIKINKYINEDNINILFDIKVDYLIDCCDALDTKKAVIKECLKRKIKFISCMGTGKKLDPSKLKIIDLRKTTYDPLAKKLRKWLSDEKINGKVLCCSSTEPSLKMASNIIGSAVFVPASAGLLIASYVVRDVINDER